MSSVAYALFPRILFQDAFPTTYSPLLFTRLFFIAKSIKGLLYSIRLLASVFKGLPKGPNKPFAANSKPVSTEDAFLTFPADKTDAALSNPSVNPRLLSI